MVSTKLQIKKEDTVKVLVGKDKGKSGKVVKVLPAKGRVVVENVNLVKRHTRPTQANQEGGIVVKEASVDISNVMLVCPACDVTSRTGIKVLEDGGRARFCKKCNEIVDK